MQKGIISGNFICFRHVCTWPWGMGGRLVFMLQPHLHPPAPHSDKGLYPQPEKAPFPVCTKMPSCVPGCVLSGLRLPKGGTLYLMLEKVPHGLMLSVCARASSYPFSHAPVTVHFTPSPTLLCSSTQQADPFKCISLAFSLIGFGQWVALSEIIKLEEREVGCSFPLSPPGFSTKPASAQCLQ